MKKKNICKVIGYYLPKAVTTTLDFWLDSLQICQFPARIFNMPTFAKIRDQGLLEQLVEAKRGLDEATFQMVCKDTFLEQLYITASITRIRNLCVY